MLISTEDDREEDVLIKTVVAGASQGQREMLVREGTALFGMVRGFAWTARLYFILDSSNPATGPQSSSHAVGLHMGRHLTNAGVPGRAWGQPKAMAPASRWRWRRRSRRLVLGPARPQHSRASQPGRSDAKGAAAPAQEEDCSQGRGGQELRVSALRTWAEHSLARKLFFHFSVCAMATSCDCVTVLCLATSFPPTTIALGTTRTDPLSGCLWRPSERRNSLGLLTW